MAWCPILGCSLPLPIASGIGFETPTTQNKWLTKMDGLALHSVGLQLWFTSPPGPSEEEHRVGEVKINRNGSLVSCAVAQCDAVLCKVYCYLSQ